MLFGSFASFPIHVAALVLTIIAAEKQYYMFLSLADVPLTAIVDGEGLENDTEFEDFGDYGLEDFIEA